MNNGIHSVFDLQSMIYISIDDDMLLCNLLSYICNDICMIIEDQLMTYKPDDSGDARPNIL